MLFWHSGYKSFSFTHCIIFLCFMAAIMYIITNIFIINTCSFWFSSCSCDGSSYLYSRCSWIFDSYCGCFCCWSLDYSFIYLYSYWFCFIKLIFRDNFISFLSFEWCSFCSTLAINTNFIWSARWSLKRGSLSQRATYLCYV